MYIIIAVILGLFFAGQSSAVFFTAQRCSSLKYQPAICRVNLQPNQDIVHVTVDNKISKSDCEYTKGYDFSKSSIWVDKGCRAQFNVFSCKHYRTMDCSSINFKHANCPVASSPVNYVVLQTQYSKTKCVLNENYGLNGNGIFVTNGCRGKFLVCYEECMLSTK